MQRPVLCSKCPCPPHKRGAPAGRLGGLTITEDSRGVVSMRPPNTQAALPNQWSQYILGEGLEGRAVVNKGIGTLRAHTLEGVYEHISRKTPMDFYIIHGLILCLLPTLKIRQNLFGILVSSLQLTELNTFINIVFYYSYIYNTLDYPWPVGSN